MLKYQFFIFVSLIVSIVFSEPKKPINILVYSTTKPESIYKKSIDIVIAENLNKTGKISAKPVHDNKSVLTENNLEKYDALFFVHSPGIGQATEKTIVSMVQSGKLGLVASHDALRNNEKIRNLIGMTKMYTDYIDIQTIWTVQPEHPIAEGVQDTFVLNPGQPYVTFTVNTDVNMIFRGKSNKDKDLYIGWSRNPGKGRTFYFCPEHETFAHYNDPNVQKIFSNAAFWVTDKPTEFQSFKVILNPVNHSKISITPFLHSGPWNFYLSIKKNTDRPPSVKIYDIMGRTIYTNSIPKM